MSIELKMAVLVVGLAFVAILTSRKPEGIGFIRDIWPTRR